MYIVKEEYGFQYESNHSYTIGYTESLEEAQDKVIELEATHNKYAQYIQLDNELYESMLIEGTEEEEEAYHKASKYLKESMELEWNCGYDYDYYYVTIEEIKHL